MSVCSVGINISNEMGALSSRGRYQVGGVSNGISQMRRVSTKNGDGVVDYWPILRWPKKPIQTAANQLGEYQQLVLLLTGSLCIVWQLETRGCGLPLPFPWTSASQNQFWKSWSVQSTEQVGGWSSSEQGMVIGPMAKLVLNHTMMVNHTNLSGTYTDHSERTAHICKHCQAN